MCVTIMLVILIGGIVMSDKSTSSRPIKVFAKIIFVIGIIFDVIVTAGIIIGGIGAVRANATPDTVTGLIILTVICAIIFFFGSFLLLLVEKAMLMSYAEIAEDVRDVRNILTRRDQKN